MKTMNPLLSKPLSTFCMGKATRAEGWSAWASIATFTQGVLSEVHIGIVKKKKSRSRTVTRGAAKRDRNTPCMGFMPRSTGLGIREYKRALADLT